MEYYVTRSEDIDSLEHAGILGMKWGVRRYQNEDGTLTEAGKKRYGTSGQSLNEIKETSEYYQKRSDFNAGEAVNYQNKANADRAKAQRLSNQAKSFDRASQERALEAYESSYNKGLNQWKGDMALEKAKNKDGSITLDKTNSDLQNAWKYYARASANNNSSLAANNASNVASKMASSYAQGANQSLQDAKNEELRANGYWELATEELKKAQEKEKEYERVLLEMASDQNKTTSEWIADDIKTAANNVKEFVSNAVDSISDATVGFFKSLTKK